MSRTYSLQEVASRVCGNDLKLPELWVKRRIREGTFHALKVGRTYRMTQQQLDNALKTLETAPPAFSAPEPNPEIEQFIPDELLTPTTRRRCGRR